MHRPDLARSFAIIATLVFLIGVATSRAREDEREPSRQQSRLPAALIRSESGLVTNLVSGTETGATRIGFDTRDRTVHIRRIVREQPLSAVPHDVVRDQVLESSFEITSVAAGIDVAPVVDTLYVAGTDPASGETRIERWTFSYPDEGEELPSVTRDSLFAGSTIPFVRKIEIDPDERFLMILAFDGALYRLDLMGSSESSDSRTLPALVHDTTSVPLLGHAIDMEFRRSDRVGLMLVIDVARSHDATITLQDPDDNGRFDALRIYNGQQWAARGFYEPANRASPVAGIWRAWIESPGGELPFSLLIDDTGSELRAQIGNGSEWIDIPSCTFEGASLVFEMPHYDSRFNLTPGSDGVWSGRWKKRRGKDKWADMFLHATRNDARRFTDLNSSLPPSAGRFDGRWAVDFATDDDPAVAIFRSVGDSDAVTGTILTTTGDYRYLAGNARSQSLRLSCFDGAHAFLFHIRHNDDGTLSGDFWSSANWHETFTATREDQATLPDAFVQTSWNNALALEDVSFPDLDGTPRSLADPAFAGKARILQIFGSWCPNCHDASDFMAKLDREFGPQGLSILGLAFELTGEHERDAEQARRYAERHGVTYPILIAGVADKAKATESLGLLDRVRSFPTTVFLHGDGRVRAIHTGFTGPATGEAYDELRANFRAIIKELLAESD